jgi:hypothetical protein
MYFGAKSAIRASKPFQKVAAVTPVPGSTFSSINWCKTVATCRRWTLVRGVLEAVGMKRPMEIEPIALLYSILIHSLYGKIAIYS